MAQVQLVKRPRRWDEPFAREPLHAGLIEHVLSLPAFKDIDPKDFPSDLALHDIIANDGRIVQHARGDIVFAQGSYGTSLYIVLCGSVRCLLTDEGERAAHRLRATEQKFWLRSLLRPSSTGAEKRASRVANVDWLIAELPTAAWGRHQIFGELEALVRAPRNHTVFADSDETILLELRWPGVRELRHWSDALRHRIDTLYRRRNLETGLRASPLLAHVDDAALALIARYSRFETHGSLDWTHRYQRDVGGESGSERIIEQEPIILEQDHYLDDLILLQSGFARVTEKFDRGERTVGYLAKGDAFGLPEIAQSLASGEHRRVRYSLRAIGYADIIRIPAPVVEKYLLASLPRHAELARHGLAHRPASDAGTPQTMLDFLVDNRFINGTKAMAINTDRCVNCDDCVRACAATHNNIPRFVRHGPIHHSLMIANACMHCVDPVCLVDCPTNAIHRDPDTGNVVIDEATCIGCATCASACPYNNIRMEEVRNASGAFHIDEDGAHVLRATKCDLCAGQRSGPACQRACPHDALIRVDIQDNKTLSDWLKRSP